MIRFSLYENADDSLKHGLEHLESAVLSHDKHHYKQAILLISQSVELFLKQLLAQINPVLMFDKNSLYDKCSDWINPTLQELYNCKSLEINHLCNEVLKRYSGTYHKGAMKSFEKLVRERNKLQHFSIDTDESTIKGLILQVYHDVIAPAVVLIADGVSSNNFNKIVNEHLDRIFCVMETADREDRILSIEGKDFTRGCCFKCGAYSLFIIYDRYGSYPEDVRCSSCGYERKGIPIENYMECPGCGVNSLLYDDEFEAGTCLNYRCENHKDGGILISMAFCKNCDDYKIEGTCKCNANE